MQPCRRAWRRAAVSARCSVLPRRSRGCSSRPRQPSKYLRGRSLRTRRSALARSVTAAAPRPLRRPTPRCSSRCPPGVGRPLRKRSSLLRFWTRPESQARHPRPRPFWEAAEKRAEGKPKLRTLPFLPGHHLQARRRPHSPRNPCLKASRRAAGAPSRPPSNLKSLRACRRPSPPRRLVPERSSEPIHALRPGSAAHTRCRESALTAARAPLTASVASQGTREAEPRGPRLAASRARADRLSLERLRHLFSASGSAPRRRPRPPRRAARGPGPGPPRGS